MLLHTVVRTSCSWSRRLSLGKSSWMRCRSPSSCPRWSTAPLPTPFPLSGAKFRASCPRYLSYSASLWTWKRNWNSLQTHTHTYRYSHRHVYNNVHTQSRSFVRRTFHSPLCYRALSLFRSDGADLQWKAKTQFFLPYIESAMNNPFIYIYSVYVRCGQIMNAGVNG